MGRVRMLGSEGDTLNAISIVEELLADDIQAGLLNVEEAETVGRWLRRQRRALEKENTGGRR